MPVRWGAAILHNDDYKPASACRVAAYNTALCKIAWGWFFCGAFFGAGSGAALWLLSSCAGFCVVAAKDNVLRQGGQKT